MNANTYKGRSSGNGTPQDLSVLDLPISTATQTALNAKQNNTTYITANTTAVNNARYIANGTFTITDIASPVAGSNYKVTVANGLVTIGGTAYDRGSEITRIFDGSVWQEIYTNPNDLVISTSVNIITTKAWRGRVVKIVNGSSNISVTVNHEFTASGTKGSGTVQFVSGSVTIFPMLGTITLLTGVQGSQWQITKREGVANAVNLTLNPQ
jgi:hypothetical protein